MILKTERKKLKRILANKYIQDVLKDLASKDHFNKEGKPFTKAYVSNVLNGKESNSKIEDSLYKVYEERKLQQTKKRAIRKKILQN